MTRRRIPLTGLRRVVRARVHLERSPTGTGDPAPEPARDLPRGQIAAVAFGRRRRRERAAATTLRAAVAATAVGLPAGCTTDIHGELSAGSLSESTSAPSSSTSAPGSTTPSAASGECNDNVLNGTESAIDCGGGKCAPCGLGLSCAIDEDCKSGVCFGDCIPAGCSNQFRDPDETDQDCGGACEPCADGLECRVDTDCQSGVCGDDDRCAAPSCSDDVKNGAETGTDCGFDSECGLCAIGRDCEQDRDCGDGLCISDVCAPALCANKTIDEAEADVDCGGPCPPCKDGYHCAVSDDCESNACSPDDSNELRCKAATCDDGVRNGDESDTDCGGSCVKPCDIGRLCTRAEDCAEKVCRQNDGDDAERCKAPACDDGVKNGDESAIDCGGSCKPCELDEPCIEHEDCQSNSCGGVCLPPTCDDQRVNADESDADCGGSCGPCGSGLQCAAPTDCISGLCGTDSRCEKSSVSGACASADDCLSNGCVDLVCERSTVGEGCRTNDDCTTSACGTDGTCARSFTGGGCASDDDCHSGNCTTTTCGPGGLNRSCDVNSDCYSNACAEAGCDELGLNVTTDGVNEQTMIVVQFSVAAGSAMVNWQDIALLYFFSPEVRNNLQMQYQSGSAARNMAVGLSDEQWVYVWQNSNTGPVGTNPFAYTVQIHDSTWADLRNADDHSYQSMRGANPNLVVCLNAGEGNWQHVQGTAPANFADPCQYVEPDCDTVVCDALNQ